jgi:hypothetical protein
MDALSVSINELNDPLRGLGCEAGNGDDALEEEALG